MSILRFIRENAANGIQVADVLRASRLSRRSIEQRFRTLLNRTPAEEIRRVRLEHARKLLLETGMSISAIAMASGFSSGAYLSHTFRRDFGLTPGELRSSRGKGAS